MQSLTTMTLAALALAGVTYAVDTAWAKGPAPCETREVSLYFERGAARFNAYSQAIVERIASEAKTCSGGKVIAHAPSGPLAAERADAIAQAFDAAGVTVTMVSSPRVSPQAEPDSMASRAASVRLASGADADAIS